MSTVSNKPQHGDPLVEQTGAANAPFQEFLDDLVAQVNANVGDIEILQELIGVALDEYRIVDNTRLEAASGVAQNPAGLDAPVDISFGGAQTNEFVTLTPAGLMTFNKAANYIIRIRLNFGRAGSAGEARMFFRAVVNGAQFGSPIDAVIDSARIVVPLTFTRGIDVAAGDTLKLEMYRDSAGVDDGGLVATTSAIGWGTSASAEILIEEYTLEKRPAES